MVRSSKREEPRAVHADNATPARVASSASLRSLGAASDTEGSERPLREKLKKTSIAGVHEAALDQEMSGTMDPTKSATSEQARDKSDEKDRGRVRKKRSYEDMGEEGQGIKMDKHSRKRSRDLTIGGPGPEVTRRKTSGETEEAAESNGDKERSGSSTGSPERAEKNAVMSPKGKRNREEFEDETHVTPPLEGKETSVVEPIPTEKPDRPKTKRHRESNSPESNEEENNAADIKPGGFSNISVTSPFAALASKSPTPSQTSDSAFKSSGFGALASSATSGFGALGASKPTASPFGGAASTSKPTITGLSSSKPSSFGGPSSTENKSPPAAAPSGFGALGGFDGGFGGGKLSGFGGGGKLSTFGGGGKLGNFGGGSGPKITGLSEKPAKPFGASKDDEEDEGSGDEGDPDKVLSPTNAEDKKDERFFEQDVETGEENEETIFVCRAKLYNFVKVSDNKKEWKERGLGNLKLNIVKPSGDEDSKAPKRARFIMRADGSHRVVLNSPVQKELKVGDVKGGRPTNSYVYFFGTMDGQELELLQLKMKQPNAEALWDKVTELQQEM